MVALLILLISISPRIPLPIHIPKRSFDLRFEDIFLLIIIPIWCWLLCLRPRIYLPPLSLPIFFYSLIITITTLWALLCQYTVWDRALVYVLKEFQYFIMFILVANCIRNRQDLKKAGLLIIYVGLVSVAWAIYQLLSGSESMIFNVQALEGYYRHERLTTHYGIGLMGEVSPLTVAAYFSLMSFLAYSFYLFYSRRPLTKLFFLMTGLSFTVCSILSGEKIALLFFAVCIAVLSCLEFRKMKGLIVSIAMLIILMVIVRPFIEGTSYAHVDRVFQVRGYIDGIWDRINNVAWGSFIYVGFQHFFTGVGKGGFHHVFEEAHNQYIKVFFESGVFGLLSFVFLLGAAGSMCIKVFRQARDEMGKVISSTALCCLVGLSIAAVVQDAFKPVLPSELFWIFMGMTAAIYGIETNDSGSLVSGGDNGERRK
ncbi:MAG: hypothetical protein NTV58_17510 [Deltaproteobacteria bacterium]|nr:hypothetical protein [Deltaproteobacteria bacterium]